MNKTIHPHLATLLLIAVFVMCVSSVYAEPGKVDPGWTEHLSELRGLGWYLAKVVISCFSAMAVIIWVLVKIIWGRWKKDQIDRYTELSNEKQELYERISSENQLLLKGQDALLDNQITLRAAVIHVHEETSERFDHLVSIMGECKGCSDAAAVVKDKNERRLVLDSENEHWDANGIPEMKK